MTVQKEKIFARFSPAGRKPVFIFAGNLLNSIRKGRRVLLF
jgi:hypothetical protein